MTAIFCVLAMALGYLVSQAYPDSPVAQQDRGLCLRAW